MILRGSGPTTAELARLAAENGVRTLAHAEGGGVLYVHAAATRSKALALARGEPRPARRLQPAQPRARRPRGAAALARCSTLRRAGREVAGPRGARSTARRPLDEPIGHEWASDPERVATVTLDLVDGLDEALRIANDETSGLAAGIVTEDEAAAERFLDGYRGTAAFWHATTRFTDGFELTGTPETGINVDRVPGPRGPVTYRDLWLRQYRVVGDGTQTAVTRRRQARLEPRRRPAGRVRRVAAARARAARSASSCAAASPSASSPPGRSRSGCRGSASTRRPRSIAAAPGRVGARPGAAPGGLGRRARRAGLQAAQVLLSAGDVADRTTYVNARNAFDALLTARRGAGRERERRDRDRRDHLRRQRRAGRAGRGSARARGCSCC